MGARAAASRGTAVGADLPGGRSAPGAQTPGVRGRLPAGQPGPANLQCRPANNRFEGYRDSFIARIPGLDVLDLAGIAAAVVIDGGAVNTGFGKGRENNRFVRGVGIGDGRGGRSVDRIGHGGLPLLVWLAGVRKGEDRAPPDAPFPFV